VPAEPSTEIIAQSGIGVEAWLRPTTHEMPSSWLSRAARWISHRTVSAPGGKRPPASGRSPAGSRQGRGTLPVDCDGLVSAMLNRDITASIVY
jgi:hypothetical protein